MRFWLSAFIPIMFLWINHVHTQEVAHGRVECNVRCDPGYLYTKEDPTFQRGQTEPGQCNRYLWNKTEDIKAMQGTFPVPKAPKAGWIVSVTGALKQFNRKNSSFYIDMVNQEERLVVSHLNIGIRWMHGSRIVVFNEAERVGDGVYQWDRQGTYYSRPYPFTVGREFTVMFIATSDYSLTYYIDGKQIVSRKLRTPVSEVAKVKIAGAVGVSQVNVWG